MSLQLSIVSPPSTSQDKAATLLSEAYGQFVPDLTIAPGASLSLSSGETSLSKIFDKLLTTAAKSDELGKTDDEKKGVSEYLDKISAGAFDSDEGKKALEAELKTKTYLVGNSLTAADIALFASLHSYVAAATHTTLLSTPSITRHFDHVQNTPLVSSILARSTSFTPSVVPIDVDNVPVVVVEKEVKVKKPAAGAPAADAAAAAPAAKEKKEKAAAKEEKAPKEEKKEGEKGEKKPKEKKAKAEGGDKGGKKAAAAPAVPDVPAPWMIELKVGKIVDVKVHPDADGLYVEQIDVGEAEPRTVVSGLVKYIPIEEMRGKTLITVANLKPANMRGVKSFAMVLCASSKEGKDGGIEFVDPPAGSLPGDRVFFEGFEDKVALDQLNPKKKIFETVQPGFTTLDTKEAAWIAEDGKVHKIVSSKGVCTTANLIGASLS
ncbi:tRNA binding protein [Pseudohyphozyma bogoriensis]|nr:tRNA binding protein [Pseudohyphozyma bogoriensis]